MAGYPSVFLLLMLGHALGNLPLNFQNSGELFVAEKFLHLEVDLRLDKIKGTRNKLLNLDRLVVNITGRCQFYPIESSDNAVSKTKLDKIDKHYELLKDLASNYDSLFMNDIQNSLEILGATVSFPDEGENPIKNILAKVRTKREIAPTKKFVEFRNHKLFSSSPSLSREGTAIAAEEEVVLLYVKQIRDFDTKYSDFKQKIKALNLTNNKEEVCELTVREAESLAIWARLILKDFERVIQAIAHGSIPNKFFTNDYITSLQNRLDATNDAQTVSASSVNKHNYIVKIENNQLYVIILIPQYSERFDLYRFEGSLPLMEIHDSTYSVKLDPVVSQTFLAIGDTDSHRFVLAPDQINECLKVERELYCPPYVKFKSIQSSENECITNLWDTNTNLILSTCNLNVKRISNFLEEIMPNCMQLSLEHSAQVTTVVPGENGGEAEKLPEDWNKGLHTIKLTKQAYLIATSFQSGSFDPNEGSGDSCSPEIQAKIEDYWLPYQESLSEIDPNVFEASKSLYTPLTFRKPINHDYLEMHIFSIYSHLHILVTIVIFTFIKWSCIKLINCMSTKNSNEYEMSSFKRNTPHAPDEGASFYPAPPPF